jgi:transposase
MILAQNLAFVCRATGCQKRFRTAVHIHAGRANVRQSLYMPALVAARFNPEIKEKYAHLISIGKPAKVAITAVMRKLIVMTNALLDPKSTRLNR